DGGAPGRSAVRRWRADRCYRLSVRSAAPRSRAMRRRDRRDRAHYHDIATTTSTTSAPTPTTTTTLPPLCGNSQIDAGEECDDGNTNDDDGCTNFCTICGNNVISQGESCDSTEVGPGLP